MSDRRQVLQEAEKALRYVLRFAGHGPSCRALTEGGDYTAGPVCNCGWVKANHEADHALALIRASLAETEPAGRTATEKMAEAASAKLREGGWTMHHSEGGPEVDEEIILAAMEAALNAALSLPVPADRSGEWQKAIEFGEYLAKSAEQYLRAERDNEALRDDLSTAANDAIRDGFSALNSAIYEFRKRVPRSPLLSLKGEGSP
jgi:hypothetical protein